MSHAVSTRVSIPWMEDAERRAIEAALEHEDDKRLERPESLGEFEELLLDLGAGG